MTDEQEIAFGQWLVDEVESAHGKPTEAGLRLVLDKWSGFPPFDKESGAAAASPQAPAPQDGWRSLIGPAAEERCWEQMCKSFHDKIADVLGLPHEPMPGFEPMLAKIRELAAPGASPAGLERPKFPCPRCPRTDLHEHFDEPEETCVTSANECSTSLTLGKSMASGSAQNAASINLSAIATNRESTSNAGLERIAQALRTVADEVWKLSETGDAHMLSSRIHGIAATMEKISALRDEYEYPPTIKNICDRCEANVVSFSNDDVSELLHEINRLGLSRSLEGRGGELDKSIHVSRDTMSKLIVGYMESHGTEEIPPKLLSVLLQVVEEGNRKFPFSPQSDEIKAPGYVCGFLYGMSAPHVGGCGKEVLQHESYRCADCTASFHRACINEHFEADAYIKALRDERNQQPLKDWKDSHAKEKLRAEEAVGEMDALRRERNEAKAWADKWEGLSSMQEKALTRAYERTAQLEAALRAIEKLAVDYQIGPSGRIDKIRTLAFKTINERAALSAPVAQESQDV